eukprot:TRINITY_DN4338_c0_g1_i2.p1 TRINITY_DN4338_c0_g1~~TRINITY_DN4338_c0_g1_i2.p1  ORF type:complete len:375 (-),score=101.53 TRINITY_DN4338_c0_g1_i2:236-1360(-)
MFFVQQGEVCVKVSEGGEEKVIATLKEGAFFGEMGLLYSVLRTADVYAATNVQLSVLSRDDFERFRYLHPEVVKKVKAIAEERFNWFKKNLVQLNYDEFSEEQVAKFRQVFQDVDLDGNEKIDAEELKTLLYRLNGKLFSDSEIGLLMKKMDSDGNKTIDFKEFITGLRHLKWLVVEDDEERQKEVKNRFKVFKRKLSRGTPVIERRAATTTSTTSTPSSSSTSKQTPSSAVTFAIEPTEEERRVYEQIFRDVDADGNGKIDLEELDKLIFLLNGQHFTSQDLLRLRKKFDRNNKGYIELADFIDGIRHLTWFVRQEDDQEAEEAATGENKDEQNNESKQNKVEKGNDNFSLYLGVFSILFLVISTFVYERHFS